MRSKIDIEEVRRRSSALTIDYCPPSTVNVNFLYESLKEKYSFNNVKLMLKDWRYFDVNTNMAFAKVMDVYNEVCTHGTDSEIRYATNIITENILHKVRNGKQAEECVHRKIGWNKRKLHEKIDDRLDDLKGAIHGAGENFKNGVEDIKAKNKAQLDKLTGKDKKKEEAAQEGYQAILDKCIIVEQCDRILNNHNKLSKRFNIDKLVREVYSEDDIVNTTLEFCKYIDTYDMPIKIRYNVALENILYCFDKNNITYNPSTIASTITDYFLMTNVLTESVIEDMRYILSKNRFYTDDDLSSVAYIFQNSFDESTEYEDDDIAILEEAKKKEDSKKELNKFKMAPKKTVNGVKSLISKMYVKCNDSIINETVNIFSIIRVFFVLGATTINPALGLITFLTDQFVKLDMNRKSADKVIIQYEKEIDKVERQIDKAKNENNKKKLTAYRDKLKEELRKIENHFDKYFTDTENEKRTEDKYEREAKRDAKRDSNKEKDDFDYSFDNINFEQGELNAAAEILLVEQLVDKIKDWNPDIITSHICENINNISLDDLDCIVEIAEFNPDLFNILKFKNSLESANAILGKQIGLDKYIRMDCYSENARKLDNIEYVNEVNTDILNLYHVYTNLDLAYEGIKEVIQEADQDKGKQMEINTKPKKSSEGDDVNAHTSNKTGVSAATKVKIAGMALKKGIQKGVDTEQNLSRKIDMSMDSITKNIDRALSASNREAVINGTILPSASKVIKGAIVTGAAFLVNPAIAVIGLLGYLAMSAKHRQKERQLIMDELDVELNMCERYIKLAEEKNDMKAIKNLLQTKRALEKQRANLKYNMKFKYRDHANLDSDKNPTGNED